jgi:hypothetical protein
VKLRIFRTVGVGFLILTGSFAGGWLAQQATGSSAATDQGKSPLAEASARQVTASRGTIRSVIVLDGSVVADQDATEASGRDSIQRSRTIEAGIRPEQLVRFSKLPATGKGKVDGGPATQDCRISRLTGGGPEAPTRIQCRFPERIGYPGVGAELALTVGEARDVVTLPLSAVDGSSERGVVYVVENGKRYRRDVKLGLHDGVNVEIASGLKTGAVVLDPPPSVFEPGGK